MTDLFERYKELVNEEASVCVESIKRGEVCGGWMSNNAIRTQLIREGYFPELGGSDCFSFLYTTKYRRAYFKIVSRVAKENGLIYDRKKGHFLSTKAF